MEGSLPAHLTALPAPGSPEAVGTLIVANDCRVTESVMVEEAGLYGHAAQAIVANRNGDDGICGSFAGGTRFGSLDDLLDTSYVGPRNVERLVRYAEKVGANPAYRGGNVEGILFSDVETFNALVAVNGASEDRLSREVGLRADTIKSIVAARPIASLVELSEVHRVGPRSLENLRNWASPRVQGSFILDERSYSELEYQAVSFLFDNEVFAWDLVQLADYDDKVLASLHESLEEELRSRVEKNLFGRPYPSSRDALSAVLQSAASIQRCVRVEGWSYIETL